MRELNSETEAPARVIEIPEPRTSMGNGDVVVLKMPRLVSKTRAALESDTPVGEQKTTSSPKHAPQKPRVAPAKRKSGKKASPGKKAPTGRKASKSAKKNGGPRKGSKTQRVLELLKRPNGAALKEITKATGWQAHSVRGFLSGTVGKKLGLTLTSTKSGDGERSYSIKG